MGQTPTIQQRRAGVAAAASLLAGLGDAVVSVGNDDLGPFLREVDDLAAQMEAARVALLAEALSRGVVATSDSPSAAAWVIQWAPTFRAGGAAALVTVAHATRAAGNTALAAAVLGARVGVRNAAVALAEMDKLGPRLREEAVEAVWEGFIQVATDHGPNEIRGLRDALIAAHGHEGEFQRRQDQLKDHVSLSAPFDDDGMAEYRLRLDPEGKEVLEAMLGTLSAPTPTPTCPDLRSSDQRRGDALVAICRRAAAAGTASPSAPKTALWVTVRLEELKTGRGAGSTLTGQPLAIETIRKMACDAMIIPVVMGAKSEILDVGRAKRLFTGALLDAIRLRDKGCTISGCTAPPQWADAHHLISWVDGGTTCLLNGALLCGRHHTIAHQRGWTATATASEVTWHL